MLTGIDKLNEKIKELVEEKASEQWTKNIKDALVEKTKDMENAVSDVKFENGAIKIELKEGVKVAKEYETSRGTVRGNRQNIEGMLEGEGGVLSDNKKNFKWLRSIRDRK